MSKLKTITKNSNLLEKSVSEISDLLDKKEVSSVELTKLVLEQIKREDSKIKAFITVSGKEALEQAQESDKRRTKGLSKSKIDGIPISLKDNILTKGIRTTAASKMLSDFVPAYDATIVERLKNAGAVIVGKCNMDAWAHGSSTENSQFFTTHNPYDLKRVPGGSSGGSCAAVASGMGFASFGTDTGGSIRQPAGFCGVVGLKPTYGRSSRYGLVAMASSLDVPGPITKTAEDAAILLEIISGNDPKDSTTVSHKEFHAKQISNYQFPISNKFSSDKFSMSKLKIGLPKEYFAKGLDPKVEEKVRNAVKILEGQGAKIKEISLPMTDYALAVYYIVQPAEVSSNLARYDGIRFGYSAEQFPISNFQFSNKSQILNSKIDKINHLKLNKNLKLKIKNLSDLYCINRAEGFGDEAKRRIMLGTYVLSSGYFDAYYKKAMKVRTLVIKDFEKAFREVDVIITPTSPTLPFKIGEREKDPLSMYLADVYTVGANIAGIPGVSIPVGKVEGLPVGMQILGPQWSEELILNIADKYEKLIK
jgi:aspartyl-tRNA(Asn)/glutamyl-tRNA(Gln) amidotransferase subunit A